MDDPYPGRSKMHAVPYRVEFIEGAEIQ